MALKAALNNFRHGISNKKTANVDFGSRKKSAYQVNKEKDGRESRADKNYKLKMFRENYLSHHLAHSFIDVYSDSMH